jgi:aryl-alcohol dehydrogenase-like predicted oxidoreductase
MGKPPPGITPLGKTGLDITRVGLGAWAMGGSDRPISLVGAGDLRLDASDLATIEGKY